MIELSTTQLFLLCLWIASTYLLGARLFAFSVLREVPEEQELEPEHYMVLLGMSLVWPFAEMYFMLKAQLTNSENNNNDD